MGTELRTGKVWAGPSSCSLRSPTGQEPKLGRERPGGPPAACEAVWGWNYLLQLFLASPREERVVATVSSQESAQEPPVMPQVGGMG